MIEKIYIREAFQAFDETMKKMLDLGQASMPEHQFRAYRKMAMAIFANGKKRLTRTGSLTQGQGQSSLSEPTAKGVVTMDG